MSAARIAKKSAMGEPSIDSIHPSGIVLSAAAGVARVPGAAAASVGADATTSPIVLARRGRSSAKSR